MYKSLFFLVLVFFLNACESKPEQFSQRERKAKFAIRETWEKNKNTKEQTSYKQGKSLYRPCAACHGLRGEKEQFGSEALKGWSTERTIQALKGYQNDTYGRGYKPTMKLHVKRLTDEQITLIAEYIATF